MGSSLNFTLVFLINHTACTIDGTTRRRPRLQIPRACSRERERGGRNAGNVFLAAKAEGFLLLPLMNIFIVSHLFLLLRQPSPTSSNLFDLCRNAEGRCRTLGCFGERSGEFCVCKLMNEHHNQHINQHQTYHRTL